MMVDVFDSQNASTEVGLKNLRVARFPGFVHFVDHFFPRWPTLLYRASKFFSREFKLFS